MSKSEDRFRIKVIVVEDEPPTLRRIADMIGRVDDSFLVIATALNGQEALERMREKKADVVFTDINMPVLDGLGLMDQIQKNYPDCMIVVLSGYQDYQYMSHAIRANSFDYLLKPISLQAMQDILKRIKEKVLVNQQARLSKELTEHLSKAAPADKKNEEYNAELGVALFCAGGIPYSNEVEMYPGVEEWTSISLEELAHTFAPAKDRFVWEFVGQTAVERILILRSIENAYGAWFKQIYEALTRNRTLPVSCVCLSSGVTIVEINSTLKLARSHMQSGMHLGERMFVCLKKDELSRENPDYPSEDREISKRLAELPSGLFSKDNIYCDEIFARMNDEYWTQARIAKLFISTLQWMEHDEREKIRAFSEQYRSIVMDAVSTSLSVRELRDELRSIDLTDGDESNGKASDETGTAEAIKQYLDEYYMESITNQTLSDFFGYVPSYISILFRQRYSISPSEYLVKVRLKEAKKLFQADPDILVRDVAERVGFKNQHHFSRVFRKYEGMWPSGFQAAVK